jgi:branched-chain amino acid transport system substrate-binding protein
VSSVRSPVTIGLIVLVVVLLGAVGYLAAYPPTRVVTTTVTAPGGAAQVTTVTQVLTTTVTQAAPQPQMIECRLGFAMAVSGPYAVDGPVRRDGGILAIEHINKYLESIGAPIRFRYVHDDTKGTAADALKVVQSMYAAGIRVIIGPFASGEVRGVMDFANSNKIIIISPSSTSPLLAAPDYIFRAPPTDLFQAKVLAQLMNSMGIKKVAAIVRGDDYGRGLLEAFRKEFTTQYGGILREIVYTVGQPDYASEVARLSSYVKELGADASTAVLIIAFEDDGSTSLDMRDSTPY